MTEVEINIIVEKASDLKNLANSKVENYKIYPAARDLYQFAFEQISKVTNISDLEKTFLSAIYLYESLDCNYSFILKKQEFDRCRQISIQQQNIIREILDKYSENTLPDENFVAWYKYLKDHLITAELKQYFPIAKELFENKNYFEALKYFRRSEEILQRRDYSGLDESYQFNYELNEAIIKFNISQCQIGLLKLETENKEFLERQIVKGLLLSLDLNRAIIKKSSDSFYGKLTEHILSYLKNTLNTSINSWQTLYDYTNSEELFDIMSNENSNRANQVIKTFSTSITKVDYLLFYTHGFNTRGAWKNDLTQVISDMQRRIDINFIQIPWDYGIFVFKFFIKRSRQNAIKKFKTRFQDAIDLYGNCAGNFLIAHSFGTYITGTAIQENENFTCDKIIFAGNILNVNYDWNLLKKRNQIKHVLIEKSTNDVAVLFALIFNKFCFQKWIGYAGRYGFKSQYAFINVIESKSGHSGMLTKKNMIDNWFTFLKN